MIIRSGLQVRLRSAWTSGWEFLKDNASSRTSEPLQAVVHYTNYLINSNTPMHANSLTTKPEKILLREKWHRNWNFPVTCFYYFHLLVKFILFILSWNSKTKQTSTIINLVVSLQQVLSGNDFNKLALLKVFYIYMTSFWQKGSLIDIFH